MGGVRAPYSTDLQKKCTKTLVGKMHGTHVEYVVHSPAPQLGPTPNGKVVFLRISMKARSPSIEKRRGGEENVQAAGRGLAEREGVCVCVLGRGEARRGEATRPPCF